MKLILGLAMSLLSAGYASGQVSTTCNTIGSYTYCNSTGQSSPSTIDTNQVPLVTPDYNAIARRGYVNGQAVAHDRMLKQVGDLVTQGRCLDAKNVAVRSGDFQTAQLMSSVCRDGSVASQNATQPVAQVPSTGGSTPPLTAAHHEMPSDSDVLRHSRLANIRGLIRGGYCQEAKALSLSVTAEGNITESIPNVCSDFSSRVDALINLVELEMAELKFVYGQRLYQPKIYHETNSEMVAMYNIRSLIRRNSCSEARVYIKENDQPELSVLVDSACT